MWSKLLAFLSILALSQHAFSFELIEKAYPTLTGAQVFVLTEEPDAFFAALKEKGVDTVFFRVFHNQKDRTHLQTDNPCPEGGVYFKTDHACVVSDVFSEVLAAGQKHGISVYAWMATRSLSFLKTEDNMSLSFTRDGAAPGYGASLFNPAVKQALQALFTDIALTGADGVLIQDDFIMKYNEGAEDAACDRFTEDTGIKCSMDSFFTVSESRLIPVEKNYRKWIRWKSGILTEYFRDLRSSLRIINPKLRWAVNIYYETPVYPDRGLAWYAQDTEKLLAAGADYLAIMAYQEQIRSELSLDDDGLMDFAGKLADSAIKTAGAGRVIFKLQAKPFFGGNITEDSRIMLYKKLLSHGASSFVELPVGRADEIMDYSR